MHVVVWTSKGQCYATPSSAIVEVIPVVQARPIPGCEPCLTGLFDYRGALLPLFDSSRVLGHEDSSIRMSSRILVILADDPTGPEPKCVGLLVEHVLSVERLDFREDSSEPPGCSSRIDFLGPVALTENGTVQLTVPARLPVIQF